MVSEVEKVSVLRLTEAGKSAADDVVVRGFPLTIAYLQICTHRLGGEVSQRFRCHPYWLCQGKEDERLR
jgi:hypothetical protein